MKKQELIPNICTQLISPSIYPLCSKFMDKGNYVQKKSFPWVISGYLCCFNFGISSSQFWLQLCVLYCCGLVLWWFSNWKCCLLSFDVFNFVLNSISALFWSVCWSRDASVVFHTHNLWQETPMPLGSLIPGLEKSLVVFIWSGVVGPPGMPVW